MTKRHLTLEEQVRRDLKRAARWERIHESYVTLLSVVAVLAWLAFKLVREWRIWTQ